MRFARTLLSTLLLGFATLSLAHNVDTELEIEKVKEVDCARKTQGGDTVTVHYVGTLAFDGSKFDSSYDYGKPFTFKLGAHQVIKGWDMGLLDMCVGDKRTLTIPPNLAYGAETIGPIPGGSTLIFETELMGIEGVQPYDPSKAEASPSASPSPSPSPSPAQSEPLATPSAQPAANVTSAASDSPMTEEDDGQCHLLGPFAIVVQAALGGLALLSLVWKRYRETPRRPTKVWFFDVSKQVFGSVLLHIANIFMSMLSSGSFDVKSPATVHPDGEKAGPNPCSFYLLNLAIDTTLGIPILVVLLRLLHALFLRTPLANPPESIRSGNYGSPPRWLWWFKQSIIYFMSLFGMKLCVFFIFHLFPWIAWVGDWALRWTEGNQKIQIAFVMFIFPVIMNAIQYYIIDSFIKERAVPDQDARGEHRPLAQEDDDSDMEEEGRGERAFAVGEDEDEDEDSAVRGGLKEVNPTAIPSYDDEQRGGSSDGNSGGHRRTKA